MNMRTYLAGGVAITCFATLQMTDLANIRSITLNHKKLTHVDVGDSSDSTTIATVATVNKAMSEIQNSTLYLHMKQENSYIVDNELPTDIPTLSYENQPLMFETITINTDVSDTMTTCPTIDCFGINTTEGYKIAEEVSMMHVYEYNTDLYDISYTDESASSGVYDVVGVSKSRAGYFHMRMPIDSPSFDIDFGDAVLNVPDISQTLSSNFTFTFNDITCTFARQLNSSKPHKLLSLESAGQIESKMSDKFYHTPITEYFKYRYETIPFIYNGTDNTLHISEYWPDKGVYNFEEYLISDLEVPLEKLRIQYSKCHDLSGRQISNITSKLAYLSSVPHERYLCTYHWKIKNPLYNNPQYLSITKFTILIRYPIAYMGPIDNLDKHLTNFTLFNYIISTTDLEQKLPLNITTIRLKGVRNCYVKDTMVEKVAIISTDDVNVVYDKQLNTLTKTTDDTNTNTYTITRNRFMQDTMTQKCIDDSVEPLVLEPINASLIQPSPIHISSY